jgi:nucleotidyltransferase/DNA polymerase involved in DNA repair
LCTLPVQKLPSFGKMIAKAKKRNDVTSKQNDTIDLFCKEITTVGAICKYSCKELEAMLGSEVGLWMYNACRGTDHSVVLDKGPPKSLMSSMSLTPFSNDDLHAKSIQIPLYNLSDHKEICALSIRDAYIKVIFSYLATELLERILEDMNEFSNRQPKTIVFSYRLIDSKEKSQSLPMTRFRGLLPLLKCEATEQMVEEAIKIIANTCLSIFVVDMAQSRSRSLFEYLSHLPCLDGQFVGLA